MVADVAVAATMTQAAPQPLRSMLDRGHRLYVSCLDLAPVAYSWSVTGESVFGDPPRAITVPPGNRYLRDFATFPAWRRRGIYPRLRQAIVQKEESDTSRFWILHQIANVASANGIRKAGFSLVAEIDNVGDSRLVMRPVGSMERARAGSGVLNLPIR